MSSSIHPPATPAGTGSLDPLHTRDYEERTASALRTLTFEAAAAIELRGRITIAITLLNNGAAGDHVVAVLEGRKAW